MNALLGRRTNKVQCHLNLIQLMALEFLLERANAGHPVGGAVIVGGIEEVEPAVGGVRTGECTEEVEDPGGGATESATYPVPLRVRGAARMGLHEAGLCETDGENPE